ncbi:MULTISPECIES: hypothetical protein [unclassified Enterococcus]|uniref:hypothetical protein n=1 Tax=unclassified Enterococcus TaxID=2608891 RepID=UPI001A9BB0E9|nr:hypothetical protein [Enterococcus sp. DIV1271a]MBO1300832.1 hypothetical protein [Enterococcus sp. DIV1271a]
MVPERKMMLRLVMKRERENEKEEAYDWSVLTRILLVPEFFQSSRQIKEPYTLVKLKQALDEIDDREIGWLEIIERDFVCRFEFGYHHLQVDYQFTWKIFEKNESVIRNYLQTKMQKHGIFAYMRSVEEYLYHNTQSIDERLTFESSQMIDKLPKIKGSDGQVIVDCNQFPGYDLMVEGRCFTSCWEMYYSSYYYRLIPKEIFLEVQQVEKITQFDNQVIGIQLYRDPFRWQSETNLKFQQYYRDQLGFDHLSWDNGVGLLKEPFVEYAYTKDSLQSVQYQNHLMQPTEKKKATFFVTRNYDFATYDYKEKRARGVLNRQAFFPWVDENHSQLICYKVIDPTFTLDNGIDAYAYYINEYLNVEAPDEMYRDYLTSLRIYVPTKFLSDFPMEEISDRLSTIKFKRIRKRKGRLSFDAVQGEKRLRVVLLDQAELTGNLLMQKN